VTGHHLLTSVLLGGSVALAFASGALAGLGIFRLLIRPLALELRKVPASGSRGAGLSLVHKLGWLNRGLLRPGYTSRVHKMLVKAGEPANYQPQDILALQELGGIAGLLAGLIASSALGLGIGWCLATAVVGACHPLLWLKEKRKKRQLQISRALPFNLDLLTLGVEAGLDFGGALARVVEKGKTGPLRDELQLVLKQLKLGRSREEALRAMMARVDLPALTAFATSVIQADRMGTSLGKVLRVQSTQMRIDRTLRAEKLANQAPVKMLFPLIGCIFPTVFLVLFGPIAFALLFGDLGG
jgi:tight adherence protein C